MIKLYQPKRAFGLPCPSAFCVKLELYLRLAELPYELHEGEPGDAPKGKVPWIEDGDMSLGDSTFIIDYLKDTYGNPVDRWLSDEQLATGHVIKRMLEDSLYFVSSYSKWADDESFQIYAAELFGHLPDEQREYLPEMVRKKVLEKFNAQGIGRHTPAEVYDIGCKDIQSFAVLLGDKEYILGKQPSSFDASAFGVIGNIKDGPFPSPVRDAIRKTKNVAEYIDRIRRDFFADVVG